MERDHRQVYFPVHFERVKQAGLTGLTFTAALPALGKERNVPLTTSEYSQEWEQQRAFPFVPSPQALLQRIMVTFTFVCKEDGGSWNAKQVPPCLSEE